MIIRIETFFARWCTHWHSYFAKQQLASRAGEVYFCSTLATDPKVHKQGVASALLKHVTDMADKGGHEVCAKLSFAVSFCGHSLIADHLGIE